MKPEDLDLYRRTINEIRRLLDLKDRYGASNLPLEFSGFSNDLLYDEKVSNAALVHLIDELIQESKDKSNKEVVRRFELLNTVLTTVYERCKNLSDKMQF